MKENERMQQEKVYTRDVILILTASFFYMSCPMLVTPLIVGVAESFGSAGFVLGMIGGLMNVCSLFCRPVVGNLADRISKYKLASTGTAIMTAACLGYAFANSSLVLIFSRIIHGFGFSLCSVSISTWMAGMLPRSKIGSGMGMYGTMNALAMAVGPSVGIRIYNALGQRSAFAAAAAAAGLAMLIIQFVGNKGAISSGARPPMKLKAVDRRVLPVAIILMLFTIPYCATQSFLVSYVKAKDVPINVSLYYTTFALLVLALRFWLKGLFDKMPFGVFMVISSCSAAIAMLCLWLAKSNVYILFASVFMAGGYGIMCSVCQSTALLLASPGQSGLANSTYYVGMDLGMALGPILGGVLYGNVDIHFFYPMLMLAVPLGLLTFTLFFPKDRSYMA